MLVLDIDSYKFEFYQLLLTLLPYQQPNVQYPPYMYYVGFVSEICTRCLDDLYHNINFNDHYLPFGSV